MLKQKRASWEAHYYFSFLEPKHVVKNLSPVFTALRETSP